MLGPGFDNGYKGLKGGARCVSAMNFHSYGDLWIEPYNYIKDKKDKELARKNHMLFEAYQEFNIGGFRPDGAKYGNAAATIDYLANGEATDWMLATHNVFAFSPELGIKNTDSETFYPHKYLHKKIIETDYKVIDGFFKMHLPKFTLKSESSKIGGSFITDQTSFKTTTAKKWSHPQTEITLFNHSVGHLNDVRVFVRYNMKNGEEVGHMHYETSGVAKASEHQTASNYKKLKVTQVGKKGFLSEPIDISRRSYLHLKFDKTLGDHNNFVIMFERNGKLIGRFIHVKDKKDLENLFKR